MLVSIQYFDKYQMFSLGQYCHKKADVTASRIL